MFNNPICVALDTPDPERAAAMTAAVKRHVGLVKVGMELFYRAGRPGYEHQHRQHATPSEVSHDPSLHM